MVNTFIVAVSSPELVETVMAEAKALDTGAILAKDIHPESFLLRTKLSVLALDTITGVAHVYELDEEGQAVDTFGELNRLQRLKGAARSVNLRLEEDQIAKQIDRELSKLRRAGKLGTLDLETQTRPEAP